MRSVSLKIIFDSLWSIRHAFSDMAYLSSILRSKPSVRPCLPARLLPSTRLVEEENAPGYMPEKFYPMRLYETLNDRYQVVSKLGPGVASTAWLAKDIYQYGHFLLIKLI